MRPPSYSLQANLPAIRPQAPQPQFGAHFLMRLDQPKTGQEIHELFPADDGYSLHTSIENPGDINLQTHVMDMASIPNDADKTYLAGQVISCHLPDENVQRVGEPSGFAIFQDTLSADNITLGTIFWDDTEKTSIGFSTLA